MKILILVVIILIANMYGLSVGLSLLLFDFGLKEFISVSKKIGQATKVFFL